MPPGAPPSTLAVASPPTGCSSNAPAGAMIPDWRPPSGCAGCRSPTRRPTSGRSARRTAAWTAGSPPVGTQIDESSGASGTPYNWARSAAELRDVHRLMHQFTRYYCGTGVISINGFLVGGGGDGVNVGYEMRIHGMENVHRLGDRS